MKTTATTTNTHHTADQHRQSRHYCAECADCKREGVVACSHGGERSDYSVQRDCDLWCPARAGGACECRGFDY
jgi:hypothetical protein